MARIRQDRHGLFARFGGHLFRPIFPVGYEQAYKHGSQFKKGERVEAFRVEGTPLGALKDGDRKEIWYSHGEHHRTSVPSREIFKPDTEIWL